MKKSEIFMSKAVARHRAGEARAVRENWCGGSGGDGAVPEEKPLMNAEGR
jgi:hypothetical protein